MSPRRSTSLVLVAALVLAASPAHAQDAGLPDAGTVGDAADGGVPPDAAPAVVPAAPANPLDFDLFADDKKAPGANLSPGAAPVDPVKLARDVRRRRILLQLHQGFGFATLVTLAATVVVGQLNYVDKYSGDFTNRYAKPHEGLAIASTALFATDAALALFAPTPYKKPVKADAALAHKILMGVASAGFLAELILGPIAAAKGGDLNQRNLALGHVVTGYVTFASMLGGYLSYVF